MPVAARAPTLWRDQKSGAALAFRLYLTPHSKEISHLMLVIEAKTDLSAVALAEVEP